MRLSRHFNIEREDVKSKRCQIFIFHTIFFYVISAQLGLWGEKWGSVIGNDFFIHLNLGQNLDCIPNSCLLVSLEVAQRQNYIRYAILSKLFGMVSLIFSCDSSSIRDPRFLSSPPPVTVCNEFMYVRNIA